MNMAVCGECIRRSDRLVQLANGGEVCGCGASACAIVRRGPVPDGETPDLQSQLESLLDDVWACEANWRLDDRIDLSLHVARRRPLR